VLNGFSPINRRLPLEVLGVIPSFLVRDRDRIIATHVCHHWRNAFLSTPSLWSNISAFEHPEKTKAYLKRSGNTPLSISIGPHKPWTRVASTTARTLAPLSNRCRAVTFLKGCTGADIFTIIDNPCPRLVELSLEISGGMTFRGIEDLSGFPLLKSLTLIGDVRHLQFPQPFNLRKLGVSCNGREFRLPSLLELLAKIPLLEELEVTTDTVPTIADEDTITPVVLKHLQRIVFRGVRSKFPRTLSTVITYPNHTEIILTHYLPYATFNSPGFNPHNHMFPSGMELPTTSPPKSIRYRDVQDEDASETRCYIDLISVDGQHISIENHYGWPGRFSLEAAKDFTSKELHMQCFGFLRTLNLFLVERFCVEQCRPNQELIREVMGDMEDLETLIVVNGCPCCVFTGLEVYEPSTIICPYMRRLVFRQDMMVPVDWYALSDTVEGRATHGSPLKGVTLTSSFNRLPDEPGSFVERLRKTTEVTYDFGRSTFGWDWWKV
jgi:hypothetical protein